MKNLCFSSRAGAPTRCAFPVPRSLSSISAPLICIAVLLGSTPSFAIVDDCSEQAVGTACTDLPCVSNGACDADEECIPIGAQTTASCDDPGDCTINDRCDGHGECEAGQELPAGSSCGDLCEPGRCQLDEEGFMDCEPGPPRPGIACDDDDPCTSGDTCDGDGLCTGVEIACGDACTVGSYCDDGHCVIGPSVDCNDGNSCTSDACSPATGCQHSFLPQCLAPILSFLTAGGECGDGTVDADEECDDGNTVAGDCCSATCRFDPATTLCGGGCAMGACDGAGTCNFLKG